MKLPFNAEQFLGVFRNYNTAVFPAQIILNILALLIIALAVKKYTLSGKIILSVLSFLWIWMGLVYHIIFFSSINKMAYVFGVLFIIQGILFVACIFKANLSFKFQKGINGYVSILLLLYALVIYPLIGYFIGHVYPKSPTFGLPCPTTIFTFGILLLIENKYPVRIFIIPLLWSVIGFMAAVSLGIYEDIGLLAAGVVTASIVIQNKRLKRMGD
jgi:hypothetical protein